MRHVVVGTAGHIDHGKSALVRALTGIEPDRLKEEQARGITIDLGFANYRDADLQVAFIDVPGHERFVRNMLAGATGIDAVLLVIAADESVKPQTREHFDICRLLDVRAGAVALTKADLVDAETLELVKLEAADLLAGSFLDGCEVVPVSSRTGHGLDDVRSALRRLAERVPARATSGAARLPVDRVFTVKGFGTVVTGTVTSGMIRVDDELDIVPLERRVKVRGVQVHGEPARRAQAGQRAAVNLGGVEVGDLFRGVVLAAPATLSATRRLDAVVDVLPGMRPIRHGARLRFHQATSEVLGRIALSGPAGSRSPDERWEGEIPPGGRAHVRIRLEKPAVVTRGDRFVLRTYSPAATVAGGVVLDPAPPRMALSSARSRARFAAFDGAGRVEEATRVGVALTAVLSEVGLVGLPRADLVRRLGVGPDGVNALIDSLVGDGVAEVVADRLVARADLSAAADRLFAAVRAYHDADPHGEGLPREEARQRLFGRAPTDVFDHTVATLVRSGRLVARDRLALASHRFTPSADEQQTIAGVTEVLAGRGLSPPDMPGLAEAVGVDQARAEWAVHHLLRRKVLARLGALVFHASTLDSLKREMAGLAADGDNDVFVDVAWFKARYGLTRKYAIPLLEFLDRERVTRRIGERRLVLGRRP